MDDGSEFRLTALVAQAQGMVSAQAGCSLAEALGMLKERATVGGQALDEVSKAVLVREIRFDG